MAEPVKTWWAPIWRGLVADPEGKHVRRLDGTIWLLLYLILHAERRTGTVRCRLKTIAVSMGMPLRTVQRWLRRLRAGGYVTVRETGRVAQIGILRWKTLPGAPNVAALHRHSWRGARHGWRD